MERSKGEENMSQKLAGKVAVVTGGSSGIGLATAKRFVEEGAYVFITGRRQNELDAAVKQIGRNITGVQGDVAKLADIKRLYAAVKEQKGKLDVVFANAGIGELAPLGGITEESFDKQFDVNVKGLLFTVQKALPLLRDGGAVVLNASTASITGNPAFSVYSATKAAVRSFARTWSVDLKERKIRVNAISPGVVPTPGYNTGLGMTQEQVDQFVKSMTANVPLGRPGTTDEIAKAVLFLASDDSSYVNGIELFVDGGLAQI
jgi:NAD(P)-dependent dehydrogenase (short-subunit alcohol dehydrogenase family)